jgi:ABC-type uncharacterized transport system fused permease/ATPase subunit
MGSALSRLSGTDPTAVATRNGTIGFFAAVGFLSFVGTFNERVQSYKASQGKNKRKTSQIAHGLDKMLHAIFSKTCNMREVATVLGLSLCLLLRTLGSVWVAKEWGRIVGAIVTRNWQSLMRRVSIFAGGTMSLAVLNAYLKYYISLLKERVRQKMTIWCHDKYMRTNEMIFYKANKVGDDKIENCDHQITSDVDRFAELFASVLSQSLKPIVDFLVYSVELSRVQGLATPLTLYGWFAVASMVSTITLPPFGLLAAQEQQLDGQFRGAHSELITNCEQIAFLGGEAPEKKVLDDSYKKVYDHCIYTNNLSFNSEVTRQYLNKYFVTVIGLYLVSRPVRLGLGQFPSYTADMISTYFVSTWKNMEAISTSIQDLFELTNRVGKLSGLASRVHRLMQGLEARAPVLQDEIDAANRGENDQIAPSFQVGENLKFDAVSVFKPDGTLLARDLNFEIKHGDEQVLSQLSELFDFIDTDKNGFIDYQELKVHCDKAGLAPEQCSNILAKWDANGDGKVSKEELQRQFQGDRVLVTGGNGCGKSSMFRVIRKLWPLVCGTITMPADDQIYFLTQVNFVPLGTLRDLVTYPYTHEQMLAKGRTDEEIMECLDWAHVSPDVFEEDVGRYQLQFTFKEKDAESGAEKVTTLRPKLDDIRNWQVDLSPGQKQKLAFARLFFHQPKFVVLDECTNGISADVEQDLYDRCTKKGMAIFSISHKVELKEFHDFELHFDGNVEGSYKFLPCSETRGKILK